MRAFPVALAFTLVACASTAAQARSYLLSVTGIPLPPNEYVDTFAISTWGVRFKAVCHFPPGWSLTAGRSAAMDGTLSGEASHGVAFLDAVRLRELRGLALVTFDSPIRRRAGRPAGSPPATFAGTAHIGVYGTDRTRTATIDFSNITLTPMDRCP